MSQNEPRTMVEHTMIELQMGGRICLTMKNMFRLPFRVEKKLDHGGGDYGTRESNFVFAGTSG